MRVKVTLVNPRDSSIRIEVEATADFARRVTVVPRSLAEHLALPDFVRIERWNNVVTICSIEIHDECEEVILSQGTLTSMFLEPDEVSGGIREFEPVAL